MKLLTTNTKLAKDNEKYVALGLQLAPYTQAGMGNVCPHASAGCAAACLFSAGRGRMPNVIKARIERTKFFFQHQRAFFALLFEEIQSEYAKAQKQGKKLSVRLNTISDIAWEKIKINGKNVFEHFPHVQFMDYTKNPNRAFAFAKGEMPENYHLTFSRSECNDDSVQKLIQAGVNVAAVFRGALPKVWNGAPVVDGDETDLRFLDPKGCIVGLVEKGLAKKDQTGFVLEPC